MAHNKTQYAQLYKPDSINELVDSQKMFIDNILQSEQNYLNIIKRISASVGSVAELRTIVTSDNTVFVNGMIILVRGIGIYEFNSTSTDADNGTTIIKPTTGSGRWISLTHDANTVNGHTVETDVPADAKFTDTTYSNATQTAAGLMSGDDKKKLDGIESGANKYIHPTGDGNNHVPTTGTSNNGKFLKAGASAGSMSWANIQISDVSGAAPLASPIFTGTPKAPTGTDYTTSRIRNVRFGTTVPTSLGNGEIYFLYE